MTGQSVGIGIIGLGFGAKVHLPAFLCIPGVRVVGVADSGSGRGQPVAARIGGGVRGWGGWREALEAPGVDAVSIATPPCAQTEIVCAALAVGKHVLCEKPFGLNAQEAARMWESARRSARVHTVDFEFRMEPGIIVLKRIVESGEIGDVFRIDVSWLTGGRGDSSLLWSWKDDAESGGGVLNAFGSHVIDYVEWISGTRIVRVGARGRILVSERQDAEGKGKRVTAEDSCDLFCHLANGAVASLQFSNCYPVTAFHRIEVYGNRGRLVYLHTFPFKPDQATVCIDTQRTGPRPVRVESLQEDPRLDSRLLAFGELARRFVDATLGKAVNDLPDFGSGLRVQRVLDAARHSLRSGGEVPVSSAGP